jgi:hypothetical protein
MKKQALNSAQNETMVVYFTIKIRIFRTTPFFFIHPVYRTSLVNGKFSPELKTLDCVIFNAKEQELFAQYLEFAQY